MENYINDRVQGLTVRCYKSLLERNQPVDTRRVPVATGRVLNPI
jgi:hypothetical protein